MKKCLILLITLCSFSFTNAQTISEALQYSTDLSSGTARYQAMSGAFGALGGDVSSISINPASSAVFLRSQGAVSLGLDDIDNSANYFSTQIDSYDSGANLNQGGGVFVFDTQNENSSWRKVAIGVNYNRSQNMDNELFVGGNGNTSIGNFFLEQAQGIPFNLLNTQGQGISDRYRFLGETQGVAAQNAFLGYQGFIIDPASDDPNTSSYVSNVGDGDFNQEYLEFSDGYVGKYSFNIAAQYKDNLYIGLNLNSHIIDYNKSSLMIESNDNIGSIERIQFENNLSVEGSGFSAQLGAISKITNEFRVGLTYDTPTWYVISETTSQYLETDRVSGEQSIIEVIDPRIVNIFENYELRTPGKIGASAAYVFGQKGLLSFDYSYKDYSQITFRPKGDPFFAAQNDRISANLKAASSFRLGAEYRFDEVSLRGGLNFEQSPYEDELILGDRRGFSFGLGYNLGNYHFDIAYSRAEQDRQQQLYNIGLTDSASIESSFSSLVITLGMQL